MLKNPMYSCQETCGQEKPCGNKHCSAHPQYVPPTPKKKKQTKTSNRRPLPFYFS